MHYYESYVDGACGISALYEFYDSSPLNGKYGNVGGCGYKCAGFIPTTVCKDYYEGFKKQWQIILQTPVRLNKNSNHSFIFVVWDTLAEKVDNSAFEFPFNELDDD